MTAISNPRSRARQARRLAGALLLATIFWTRAGHAGEPGPAEPPPQAYLLPLDVAKIQDTALAELLKLRPGLTADDLKVLDLSYRLSPDPDYAIQVEKDGSHTKIPLSANHQDLTVTYLVLHTKRSGFSEGRNTIIYETAVVNFLRARSKTFSVYAGTCTQYQ